MPMAEIGKNSVGEAVQTVLARHHLRQADLAAAMGKAETTVSGYWTADRRVSYRVLSEVADALNRLMDERDFTDRFTPASLLAGPDPVEASPEQGEVKQPQIVLSKEQLQELLRPSPPEPGGVGWELIRVRLYDSAACGVADPTLVPEARIEDLPLWMAGPGGSYENTVIVVARGESMVGDGIEPGDWLIVRTDMADQALRPGKTLVVRQNGALVVRQVSADGERLVSLYRDRTVQLAVYDYDEVELVGVKVGQWRSG